MTKVNAIIPCLYEKDGEYLKLCVESLRATTDWDITVVTNGTKTIPNLSHIYGITKHLHTRDQGQCRSVNMGAEVAEPTIDYLFVVNADMYFAPGWNQNLSFEHLVFSPNLVEPYNNHGSAPPFLKYGNGFELSDFDNEGVNGYITNEVNKQPSDPTGGFNLPFFAHRELWRTVGGYDEKYDPWGSNSDTDLQTKINLAGVRPVRYRNVLVYHFSNKSGTFDTSNQEYWQRNWNYYQDKWGFNRDQLGSDVWMNERMLPTDLEQIKYRPEWTNKYAA